MRARRIVFAAALALGGLVISTTLTPAPGAADPVEHFPIGLYHVGFGVASDPNDDVEGAQLIADLEDIAGAGFDLVSAMPGPDDYVPFMTRANELGVGVVFSKDGTDDDWGTVLPIIDDFPNLVAVQGGDDVNGHDAGGVHYPVARSKADYLMLKSLSPGVSVYLSGGGDPGYRSLAPWSKWADFIGVQSYPVCNYPDSFALTANYQAMRRTFNSLTKKQQDWFVNGQTFAWSPTCRTPTLTEYRNLMWVALAHGASGILNYTYFDGGGRLPDLHPQFWADISDFNADVRAVEDFLLGGTLTTLPSLGGTYTHAAYWRMGDELLLVVYNTHPTLTRNVKKLALPAGFTGPLVPVFADYPAGGVTNNGGVVTGTVGPQGTQVYRVDCPACS
jgi:hypothetical protein